MAQVRPFSLSSALLVNARHLGQGTSCTRNLLLARGSGTGEGVTGQNRIAAAPEPCPYFSGALAPDRSGSNWFLHSHLPAPGWITMSALGPPTLLLASKTSAQWREKSHPLTTEVAWWKPQREGTPEHNLNCCHSWSGRASQRRCLWSGLWRKHEHSPGLSRVLVKAPSGNNSGAFHLCFQGI